MNNLRNISFITLICLLVLLPFVQGGCIEQIMQDQNALQCFMKMGTYVTEIDGASTNTSGREGIAKLLCSPKGKEIFGCAMTYLKKCPDILSSAGATGNPLGLLGEIPGLDIHVFLNEGLDVACAMLTGLCSEVSKCFEIQQNGNKGGIVKRSLPESTNYYLLFQLHTDTACRTMKDQMTCMINTLEKCPKSVVEITMKQVEAAMNASLSNPHGVVSFEDTKHFVMNECPKMPKGFSVNTCAKDVFVSTEFVNCNEVAAAKYAESRTCHVNDLTKECVVGNVQPKCGKEMADFLVRNTHIIFPGIPDNCDDKSNSASFISTSLGFLLLSSLLFK